MSTTYALTPRCTLKASEENLEAVTAISLQLVEARHIMRRAVFDKSDTYFAVELLPGVKSFQLIKVGEGDPSINKFHIPYRLGDATALTWAINRVKSDLLCLDPENAEIYAIATNTHWYYLDGRGSFIWLTPEGKTSKARVDVIPTPLEAIRKVNTICKDVSLREYANEISNVATTYMKMSA